MESRAHAEIILFVKYPEPGRVKTRLARSVGLERAAALYADLVQKNVEVLRLLGGEAGITIAYDPAGAGDKIKTWLSQDFRYLPQSGGNLGDRLCHAFSEAFHQGRAKVMAVGSDTLELCREDLTRALSELEECDAVVGPARDGGYYLIGLKREWPCLFRDIPWSTPRVLERTLALAKENGLTYRLLRPLEDLDELPRPSLPAR